MSIFRRIRDLFLQPATGAQPSSLFQPSAQPPESELLPPVGDRSPVSPSIPRTESVTGPSTADVEMDVWLFEDRADFPTEVVGESFRLSEVWALRRSLKPVNQEYVFSAVLMPEPQNIHDENAVAVYAAGHGRVGYIKRTQARRWGPLIQDFNRIAKRAVACKGIIRGERTLEIFLNIKVTDIQKELDRRKVVPSPSSTVSPGA